MKIVYGSDLHFEFPRAIIPEVPECDLLLLAGDITLANCDAKTKTKFLDFISLCSERAIQTLMIMGNHEHYHGVFENTAALIQEMITSAGVANFTLLDNEHFDVNSELAVFGATFWTDLNKGDPRVTHAVKSAMNDFRTIGLRRPKAIVRDDEGMGLQYSPDVGFTPQASINENRKSELALVEFLEDTKQVGKTVILLMHHLPTWLSVQDMYKSDIVSYAYANTRLDNILLDAKHLFLVVHGHTHDACQYELDGTIVVCNPRGYPGAWYGEEEWKFRSIELDFTETTEESTI